MKRQGPEYEFVQRPAIELLRDMLGYEYVSGEDLERSSTSQVVLADRLGRRLQLINPGLSDAGVRDAIKALQQPMAMNLIDANEACHQKLSRWVTVNQFKDGKAYNKSVRFFDFENLENNEFLVVDELEVKGPRRSRFLDLVVFVNGIPIVVAECKEPGDPHGISQAADDLDVYQDRQSQITDAVSDLSDKQDKQEGVARLFHTVLFTLALKKTDAQYGTIGTPIHRYAQWKSCYPLSKYDIQKIFDGEATYQELVDSKTTRANGVATKVAEATSKYACSTSKPSVQDVLLTGMLAPKNLLDMMRNFVVFDRDGNKITKKVARYQQFEAVKRTVARVTCEDGAKPSERGGVIWHTQGSGKSLTMLWLCLSLRRETKLENPKLLIVTDRRDLDRQITETFINCGFENPVRASRVSHLRQMLRGASGQTIMTTVQKFRSEVDSLEPSSNGELKQTPEDPVLSDADNVFVLIDEVHRTEYGQFNANLRQSLPNATLLGFTGTPVPKTVLHFGAYIHKYTMPQSVKDGATVPILYESRLVDLDIWGGRELDPKFDEEFEELSADQKARLKMRAIKYGELQSRIGKISRDIANHYKENFAPDGFKAQLAVCSQRAAVTYHRFLSEHLGEEYPIAVLISGTADKESEINRIKEQFKDEEKIIDRFKDEGVEELAMIIVVDKYLTGFDAPIERVLYLDKPLRDHNLLQAIARVNRPMPEKGKSWGLIVDYWGVATHLKEALATFSQDLHVDEVMRKRNDETALAELNQAHSRLRDLFQEGLTRADITPWLEAIEMEDVRAVFVARYKAFYKAMEQVLPRPDALKFVADLAWFKRLRREALSHYSEKEDTFDKAFSERVSMLIDEHITAHDAKVLLEPVDVLDDDFDAELDKLTSDRAKASRMEHALKKTITIKLNEDPVFYSSLQQRLEEAIENHRQDRIDDLKKLNLLKSVRKEIVSGIDDTADDLGLSAEAFAVYGLVMKYLGDEEVSAGRDLAETILDTLEAELVLDWVKKQGVQKEMRRKIKRALRLTDLTKSDIEPLTIEIMDLARVRMAK